MTNSKTPQLLKDFVEQEPGILNLYVYGSQVYGTVNPQSDYDFICVIQDSSFLANKEYITKLEQFGDFNFFIANEFDNLVKQHEITALECLFLDSQFILKEKQLFSFDLNLPQLRHAISSKSSNSWVKSKKKFIVEEDFNPYIGKKSAFHSLRILNFGTQIAKHHKIIDYSSANHYFDEIMKLNSWDDNNHQFKSIYNSLSTEFKLVAPKEINLITNNKVKP